MLETGLHWDICKLVHIILGVGLQSNFKWYQLSNWGTGNGSRETDLWEEYEFSCILLKARIILRLLGTLHYTIECIKFLCFNFLICRMRIVKVPTTEVVRIKSIYIERALGAMSPAEQASVRDEYY